MGLLDGVFGQSFDDPRTAATLQLAQGLLSSPRVMQGLAGGLSGYQQAMAQARQQKALEEMRAMQIAEARMKMEAAQREQAKAQGIEAAYRNAFRTPEQMAMAQNGGPTLAAAGAAPKMQAGFDQGALFSELAKVDPLTAYKLSQPTPDEFKVVGNSLVSIGRGGVKEAFRAPDKDSMPADFKLYQLSGAQQRGMSFDQWDLQRRRAGAQTLNVNTGDRIPATLVKEQDAMLDRVFNAQSIDADLAAVEGQIKSGKLAFGPVANLVNQGKNALGMSDESSRAYASFRTTLEKLRNDSLRLNTGVQTDGDAQRAWNELFQNINDTSYVKERLAEIRKINQRAANLQRERLNILRRNSGAGELSLPEIEPAIGNGGAGKVIDFNALPSGR